MISGTVTGAAAGAGADEVAAAFSTVEVELPLTFEEAAALDFEDLVAVLADFFLAVIVRPESKPCDACGT